MALIAPKRYLESRQITLPSSPHSPGSARARGHPQQGDARSAKIRPLGRSSGSVAKVESSSRSLTESEGSEYHGEERSREATKGDLDEQDGLREQGEVERRHRGEGNPGDEG